MTPMTEGSSAMVEQEDRCACGGRLVSHTVHRYRFEDEFGRVTEAHNVPARVCRRCGDAIVDQSVVTDIETRIAQAYFAPRHVDLAR